MLKNRQELEEILLEIEKLFPNASCELVYHNLYELLIAVMLSAQTTDKSVNLVTPNLFMKYPTALSLSNAEYDDVKKSLVGGWKKEEQRKQAYVKANEYLLSVPSMCKKGTTSFVVNDREEYLKWECE